MRELVGQTRLRQHDISASPLRALHVPGIRVAGDEHNRNIAGQNIIAEELAQVESVDTGQPRLSHDDVGVARQRFRERLAAVCRLLDRIRSGVWT